MTDRTDDERVSRDRLWSRLPIIIRAVITGVAVALAGTMPWAWLISANLKRAPMVPWAAPIMLVYLGLYWRYFVRGAGWPRFTSSARREHARARPVPDLAWGPALLAGALGLTSIVMLQGVLGRLVTLPQQRDIDPSRYPLVTVLLWVVTSALVAGIVEETAFRGYLQGAIERRHGPVVAILITGLSFGFAHLSHPEIGVVLLPYYLAVATVYGSLAYFTRSTLPSMILHTGGNLLSAFDLFTRGRSEWQASTTPPPLIWQRGPDAAFMLSVFGLLLVGALTVLAFAALARTAHAGRQARLA